MHSQTFVIFLSEQMQTQVKRRKRASPLGGTAHASIPSICTQPHSVCCAQDGAECGKKSIPGPLARIVKENCVWLIRRINATEESSIHIRTKVKNGHQGFVHLPVDYILNLPSKGESPALVSGFTKDRTREKNQSKIKEID